MSKQSHIANTFRHAMIYGGVTVISKVIAFFMLPIYAHYLRGEGYGIVGMVDVVISVATMLIGYGIAGAMWRFYYQKESDAEKESLVSTTIILMFLLVTVVSIPLLLLHNQIGYLAFGRDDLGYYILIATIAFIFEMTSRTAEAYILIRQKPLIYSALAILRLVIGLSLNIYLIVSLELGVLGFLYSSLICSVVLSIINHAYALSHVGIKFKKHIAREILKFSLPLIPGYVAMFFRGNADRVIMRTFMGLAQLGAYEMLNKFVSLIGILIVEPFSKSWDPKRMEVCETPEGPDTLARMFTLQWALMLFFGLVLALEIPLLLRMLTPPEFWLSGGIAFVMIMARILSYSYYQLFFGLLYAKKTNLIARIQIIASVMDVILNYLLIPRFGILGACITSCIAYFSQCCMAFFMARKYYSIPFQWDKLAKITVLSLLLFISINQFSITKLGVEDYLTREAAPVVASVIKSFHLDIFKDGKLMTHAVKHISLLCEAIVRFILCLSFLPALAFMKIIPRKIFSFRVLLQPRQVFSDL